MAKKRNSKEQRKIEVLLGLVELYLESGTPIGSNTLKERGFDHISSATIRNYFSHLEKQGYLMQQHSSGGRIPTGHALKLYAQAYIHEKSVDSSDELCMKNQLDKQTREVAGYLQHSSEVLSELSQLAVFISSPRFDQDFISTIKLLEIDSTRTLAMILTDFGLVFTETLFWPTKINPFSLSRIQSYFQFRLSQAEEPNLTPEERKIAEHFYNEIFLRHIVKHSSFYNANALTSSLSFFENPVNMDLFLKECRERDALSVWIEDDLNCYVANPMQCAILAMPYKIRNRPVGSIAVLGPSRIPYKRLIRLITRFAEILSENLTSSLCKHKISYREPQSHLINLENAENYSLLLENKN